MNNNVQPDIIFAEKSGLLAIAVNPEGRCAQWSEEREGKQKVWLFGQTVIPAINILFSGTKTQGEFFLNGLRKEGVIAEEGSVYVPFGNPERHDPNIMLREEAYLCRTDGPSRYRGLLRHLTDLARVHHIGKMNNPNPLPQ